MKDGVIPTTASHLYSSQFARSLSLLIYASEGRPASIGGVGPAGKVGRLVGEEEPYRDRREIYLDLSIWSCPLEPYRPLTTCKWSVILIFVLDPVEMSLKNPIGKMHRLISKFYQNMIEKM